MPLKVHRMFVKQLQQMGIMLSMALLLLFFTNQPLAAQEQIKQGPDTTNIVYRTANWMAKMAEKGLVIIPVAFYSPETRFGLGIGGYYYFRFNEEDTITRPSSINMVAIYTQNNQMIFQMPMQLAFKENKYLLNIDPTITRYPFRFYGIGPGVNLDESESYSADIIRLKATLMRRITPKIFFGPQVRMEYQNIREVEEGGLLASGAVPGSEGGTVWGLGGRLMFDYRDNIFTPHKGSYFNIQAFRLMGDFQGTSITADARKYFPVGERSTLALQAYWEGWSGNPPFFLLSRMGGYYRMRGYFDGAYRDKHFVQAQAGFRFPLFWRFGGAVFGGVGQVSPEARISTSELKASGGVGLRFLFNEKENINLRIDYAWGRNSSGLYLTVSEAF